MIVEVKEDKIRVCPHCGRLIYDGEVEVSFELRFPFIIESCPFCKKELGLYNNSDDSKDKD